MGTRGPKTYLYGPRIRGDIDLGVDPSSIDGAGQQNWAKMIFPGMKLAGQSDQLITAQSATQKFAIGTRRIEYGRTFRYSKCGATTTTAALARLLWNGCYEPECASPYEDRDGFYGDLLTAASVGDNYLDLEEVSAGRAANAFQGGYLTPFDTNYNQYYIVKSDASTSTYTRVYLDHPLVQAISATNGIQAYYSPYSKIIDGSLSAFYTAMGKSNCGDITTDYYFWLQTAGPCWITPTGWGATCPGYTSQKRDAYAWTDGTVQIQNTVGSLQRIGYMLPANQATIASVFIMLQLE